MKRTGILSLSLGAALLGVFTPLHADTNSHDALFSFIKGKVRVKNALGAARTVHQGNKAYAGETIQVGPKAWAEITLFDGSTLDLSSNSKITLGTLKPSGQDKVIFLKLDVGKLFAKVRKLFSPHSSFEVEAGGTVCGVRGTAFTLTFNPVGNILDVDVNEGKVGVSSGGVTQLLGAGQKGHFINGLLSGTSGTGNNAGKGTGKGSGNGGGNNNGNGGNNNSNGNNNGNNGGNNNSNAGGNNGGNNGETTGGTGGSQDTGNPSSGNGSSNTGLGGNSALGDLNIQFTTGILINGDNSLSAAQQTINIHLVIPPGENVP